MSNVDLDFFIQTFIEKTKRDRVRLLIARDNLQSQRKLMDNLSHYLSPHCESFDKNSRERYFALILGNEGAPALLTTFEENSRITLGSHVPQDFTDQLIVSAEAQLFFLFHHHGGGWLGQSLAGRVIRR